MLSFFLATPVPVLAKTYSLPAENTNLVGESKTLLARFGDTFSSIALDNRYGFDALAAANPDSNPTLPGEGVLLNLPTRHILPDAPRMGIVINLPELRLYHYSKDGLSVSIYPIGVGRYGWDTPVFNTSITSIVDNPGWTPPASIHKEYRDAGLSLPTYIPPGPDNPLGKVALRLGNTDYLIHGTNRPEGVGMRVSHGCIRMYPADIETLKSQLSIGTPVNIVNQPLKVGFTDSEYIVQAHQPLSGEQYHNKNAFNQGMQRIWQLAGKEAGSGILNIIKQRLTQRELFTGLPLSFPKKNPPKSDHQ